MKLTAEWLYNSIMNLNKKNILALMLACSFFMPTFAIDISDFGDFSTRSVIMNNLSGKERINQEQRDILKAKKLTPTSQCLIEQIKKGNLENVSILLDSKVDPNKSYMSDYPIYIAARYNKFEILKLLKDHGAKLDRGFYSELYEAVRNKNKDMAQFLIDNNAKVNYLDSITNNTILSMALKNNMKEIAAQLIQKGAKADIRSIKLIKKKRLFYLIEDK